MRRNCPTEHALLAFQLGTLPETELDELAEHLEACPHCEAVAQRLDRSADAFVAALRVPDTRVSGLGGDGTTSLPQSAPGAPDGDDWEAPPGYDVLGPLGRGGMGVVYRALHRRLGRHVALKRLRTGGVQELARARTESESLARLRHPNILQIYEVLEHAGRVFLALEYVEGGSLAARLAAGPQQPRETARLLAAVARAVDHAHGQGIVHRDLKPANILLGADAEPGRAFGTPKVADFGAAKRMAAEEGHTLDGDVIGTPVYMAPEQASGRREAVGPATDVYSLGVILYEMLTGRVPLQGMTSLDTLVLVRSAEPVSPRRLNPKVPRDLETVCLKCLEKDPRRRYASALELAEDLDRFLSGRPVRARPTPFWEHAWKWARRHPAQALLSAALALVSAVGFLLVAWQWQRAEQKAEAEAAAKREAEESGRQEVRSRREIERLSAGIALSQGVSLCEAGEVARGLVWMARALELADDAADADLGRVARCDLAAWRPYLVRRAGTGMNHTGWLWAVAFSPDGGRAVTGGIDRAARVWGLGGGPTLRHTLKHDHPVWAACFSPDGRTVLTGSGGMSGEPGEARLWDADTGRPLLDPLAHHLRVGQAVFSPDGGAFLTVCRDEVNVWRSADGQRLFAPLTHGRDGQPDAPILAAAFSPDGTLVATAGADGTARLWDAATGSARGEPLQAGAAVLALAFAPDGRTLLTGDTRGAAQLWDVASCRKRGPPLEHFGQVQAAAFSPDGRVAATGTAVFEPDPVKGGTRVSGGDVRLWGVANGRQLGPTLAHGQAVRSVAFSPGGRLLMTGCEDGQLRLFSVATGVRVGRPLSLSGTVPAATFSPDGRAVLAADAGGGEERSAGYWEVPPERYFPRLLLEETDVISLDFSPDGRTLVAGCADRAARFWDLASGRAGGPPLPHDQPVAWAGFSPDGRSVLTREEWTSGGAVRVWDAATGRSRFPPLQLGGSWSSAWAPDGRTFVVGTVDNAIHFRDARTGEQAREPLKGRFGSPLSVDVSADGRWLLTGTTAGAQLRDLKTLGVVREVRTPNWTSATLLPGAGQALLVSGGFAQVWDLVTGAVTGPPAFQPEGGIDRVVLSPGAQSALVRGTDGSPRLWDVLTGKPLGPPPGQAGVHSLAFAPRGRLCAAGFKDGRIALWEAPAPAGGTAEAVRLQVEVATGLAIDRRGVIRELDPAALADRRRRLAGSAADPAPDALAKP